MTTDPYSHQDPLPPVLREGDHFILHFADNRQIFAQALPKWKNVKGYPSCKINKRTYSTHNLIGLPYGTVLEVGRDGLIPLEDGEDLLPDVPEVLATEDGNADAKTSNGSAPNDDKVNTSTEDSTTTTTTTNAKNVSQNDNRNLVDDNTSQKLTAACVQNLITNTSTPGSHIVAALISNSATFESKTAFSQAKYVKRKQLKYQPRCRIVRLTPSTLCAAMHLKDAKKICNLREDTLGQILSNANICAGQRVLVMDTAVQGIVTGSVTRRMGGYGSVLSLYAGQQPSYIDVVHRLNLSVGEKQCLKWVSLGEVFGDPEEKARQTASMRGETTGELIDAEKRDRERIEWPAPLQSHTREFLSGFDSERKVVEFVRKRSARFTRKLTRQSGLELRALVDGCCDREEESLVANVCASVDGNGEKKAEVTSETTKAKMEEAKDKEDSSSSDNEIRQCDSLIIATKYDPTATLLWLLPYLAPSCPFVVYHEFLEPLLDTFRTLQTYYATDKNTDNGNNDNTGTGDENTDTTTNSSNHNKSTPPPMMLRRNIAINLRLTDTWFREYQVLDGRTHPNMTMSQNGGYILLGTKLCPRTGTNELSEETMKEIRAKIGGRRKQQKGKGGGSAGKKKQNKRKGGENKGNEKRSKT
eukprot:CAMPEP_0183713682 /NCGR_PEP_ID=MMETSP0737-20130205/8454_1 /TAXON_ID=385413 /ORGANISM="Thalassiosira miniscula, Strain CCMP1093" /LENGTH=642 /DNA_ID=CAMNT_0025942501 /DNA_START=91 /DNA_END=2019 /DNA_ORIENTATION=+